MKTSYAILVYGTALFFAMMGWFMSDLWLRVGFTLFSLLALLGSLFNWE